MSSSQMNCLRSTRARLWGIRLAAVLGVLLVDFLYSPEATARAENPALELTLPPRVFAVAGVGMGIYFDNIVLTQTPEDYQFQVTCDIGKAEKTHWQVTPTQNDVGEHKLQVTVSDQNGEVITEAKTTLIVSPANAGVGRNAKLLIVGDSLTHATMYPNEIARLLSLPGNPKWKMLGTHRPKTAIPGVAHEGYGGWTWQRFATKYEPKPDGTHRKRSSPFVFLTDGKPQFDVPRYFRESCEGKTPDFVIVLLGINDCFSADPNSRKAIDERIDTMFAHASTLLTAIEKAAPRAEIGLCLTTPPNSRQAAFQANYKDRYTRWGWKRIQHCLVQRQIEYARNRDRLHIVPTQLNLDPIAGYPANNGVHPNKHGYQQIGASVYCWLKSRLSENPE